MHELDACEHGVGRVKRLEVEHRFVQSLDGVVIVFNDVVEVLDLAHHYWHVEAGVEQWGLADKFAMVLEAAPRSQAELAQYCRSKGLLMEQLERWRNEVQAALSAGQSSAGSSERAADKKRIRELERDLRRKEKA